jgi:hypothetical protein
LLSSLLLGFVAVLIVELVLIQKPEGIAQNEVVCDLHWKSVLQSRISRLVFGFPLYWQVPFAPSMNVVFDLKLCDFFLFLCAFNKFAEQVIK